LYNWYACDDSRGLCPVGWHIPSQEDWLQLANYLGGTTIAGGKMKSTGTLVSGTGLWYSPNTDATNSSGFSGIPSGSFYTGFIGVEIEGSYWTSTPQAGSFFPLNAYKVGLNAASNDLETTGHLGMQFGQSVRCVHN
jgi:uncharacterized protein (TIGR02145 family)